MALFEAARLHPSTEMVLGTRKQFLELIGVQTAHYVEKNPKIDHLTRHILNQNRLPEPVEQAGVHITGIRVNITQLASYLALSGVSNEQLLQLTRHTASELEAGVEVNLGTLNEEPLSLQCSISDGKVHMDFVLRPSEPACSPERVDTLRTTAKSLAGLFEADIREIPGITQSGVSGIRANVTRRLA